MRIAGPLFLVSLIVAQATGPVATAADAPSVGRITPAKKLIEFGQDAPDSGYFRQNIREMEKVGLDGVTLSPLVSLNGKTADMIWGGWFSPSHRWTYENVAHIVADVRAAKPVRFTDNFLLVNRHTIHLKWSDGTTETLKQPDWFADDFEVSVANLALAARVCKEAGLKGVILDLEQYGGGTWSPWMFPFNYGYATANGVKQSFDECQAKVRQRGREIAAAMTKAFPEIVFIVLPDVNNVAYTTWEVGKGFNEKLTGLAGSQYALMPAFIDGMLEAAGPAASFESGVEHAYGWTVEQQFKEIGAKETERAATLSSIPETFKRRMGMAYGTWIDHRGWTPVSPYYANHFMPEELRAALHNNLKYSSRYSWIWAERAIFWPKSGMRNAPEANVPAEYLAAIADARRPLSPNFQRDDRGALTDVQPPPAASRPDYGDEATFGPLEKDYKYVADLPKTWLFYPDALDVGIGYYSSLTWDTKDWKSIEIGDYYENRGYRFNGMAWYRVEFDVPKELDGKPVYLHFGGIAGGPHIYVNGTWIEPSSSFPNGVQPWNVTPKVRYGEKNTVVVQILNPSGPGGIFKNVKLATSRE